MMKPAISKQQAVSRRVPHASWVPATCHLPSTSSSRGYTLLELIVSVGIFSIVMLIATGAYLGLMALDRQARASNNVVNNLSFAVESMGRSIRTGQAYKCNNSSGTPNCFTTAGTSFGFTDAAGRGIVYRLSGGQVIEDVTANGVTSSVPITDPNITVTGLTFYVRGVGVNDGSEPTVLFTLRGTMPTTGGNTTSFTIETSATERLLEL